LIFYKDKVVDHEQSGEKMGMLLAHLLNLMAIVCLDLSELGDEEIAEAKLEVLRAIQTPSADDLVLGQVQTDNSRQQHLDYAALSLSVNSDAWDGVPFYLQAGTGLNECKEEIRIRFKPAEVLVDDDAYAEMTEKEKQYLQNMIIIRLRPEPKITMRLLVSPVESKEQVGEADDASGQLRRVEVPVLCKQGGSRSDDNCPAPTSQGVPFTEAEQAEVMRILEPLNQPVNLEPYPEGSKGPSEADLSAKP